MLCPYKIQGDSFLLKFVETQNIKGEFQCFVQNDENLHTLSALRSIAYEPYIVPMRYPIIPYFCLFLPLVIPHMQTTLDTICLFFQFVLTKHVFKSNDMIVVKKCL